MSNETPFRISSTAIMAACILCGVLVAALLIPTASLPHHFGVYPAVNTANQSLQRTLAEFQRDEVVDPIRHSVVTRTGTARQSASPVSVAEILRTPPRRAIPLSQANYVETTSLDRAVTRLDTRGQSMPQFYAPVTVHPVTVNVDNSGIMLELARVSERLDSLARTPIPFEQVAPSIHMMDVVEPPAPIPYQVHRKDEENKKSPRLKSDSNSEHIKSRKSEPRQEKTPTAEFHSSRRSEDVVFPVPSSRSKTSVARIPIPAPKLAPIADPVPVRAVDPVPVPVSVPIEPVVIEPKLQPLKKFPIELIRPQSVPEILPPEIPDESTEELSPIGFAEELFSVPDSGNAAEPGPEVSESPGLSTIFEPVREDSVQMSPIPAEQTQVPELQWSLVPNRQGAKRTTDPPFMNGRRLPVPIPAEQFAKATPTGGIQRTSYTTSSVPLPASKSANCQCTPTRKSDRLVHPLAKSPALTRHPELSPSRLYPTNPNASKSTASRMMGKVGEMFGR